MFLKKIFRKIVIKFWQFFAKKTQNKRFDSSSFLKNHLMQNVSNYNKIKIKINGVDISQNSLPDSKSGFVSSYQKNKKLNQFKK